MENAVLYGKTLVGVVLCVAVTQTPPIEQEIDTVNEFKTTVPGYRLTKTSFSTLTYATHSSTFSFIIESWHILSPLASGTSSMPISLALYLTPSPWNLPSRYSSVFSNTGKPNKRLISTRTRSKAPKSERYFSSPLFFSFLNGTLEVAGEVGGVQVGAAVTALASPGVGRPFSTSADMVLGCASLDEWTVGDKAGSSSAVRGQQGQASRWLTLTHAFLLTNLGRNEKSRVKKKIECAHIPDESY